jgi:hypothetical protein
VTGYPVAKPALKIARQVLDTALTLPVSTKVPLERPNKFVTVGRAGGSRPNLVTDTVRLLCQVYWLSTDLGVGNVEDTCNEAIAALQDAQGTLVLEAFIRGFDNISGPVDFPDPDVPDMERWQFQGDFHVSTSDTEVLPGS